MNFEHFSNTSENKIYSKANEKPSKILWNLDWQAITETDEATIDNKLTVKVCSYDFLKQFLTINASKLFTHDNAASNSQFSAIENTAAKERFYNHYCDILALYVAGTNTVAGVFIVHPWDWSTYYIRYLNFLPEYRNQGFSKIYLDWFYETVKKYEGLDRIESEISPANQVQTYNMSRRGYLLTGTILSDRWGAMFRYTKFTKSTCEATFKNSFTAPNQPTLNEVSSVKRGISS